MANTNFLNIEKPSFNFQNITENTYSLSVNSPLVVI